MMFSARRIMFSARRIIYLIPVFLCAFCFGFAVSASDFNILRLSDKDGLTNNYIMDIAQDRNGFVWLSTESGLYRFDGSRFHAFRKGGENSIAANELNRIYADTVANVLWIATQRHGLDRLDCSTYRFTHYKDDKRNPDAICSPGVTDIAPASSGKLWVATYTDGVDLLDPSTGKFEHFNTRTVKGWKSDHVWTIREGKGGELYIGNVNDGLTVFDPRTRKVCNYRHDPSNPYSIPGNAVRTLLPDGSGNVWVGTDGGLALYNPSSETFTNFMHDAGRPESLLSNNVYNIMRDKDDRLWVSTENGGVSILDLRDMMLKNPSEVSFFNMTPEGKGKGKVSNKTVHCTFEDSFGNIWIGTYGDGVDILTHSALPFTFMPTAKPLMSLGERGGIVFGGTDGNGIGIMDGEGNYRPVRGINGSLSGSSVLAVFQAGDGRVWIGCYDGRVGVMEPGSDAIRFLDIPGSLDIRCFAERGNGEILAGNGYGIIRFSPQGEVIETLYSKDGKIRDEWLRTILVRPDGNVWVGSFGGGLRIYAPDFKLVKEWGTWNGLPTNTVNQLVEGPDGCVYAATGEGVVIFNSKGDVDKIIGVNEGLADGGVRGVRFDGKGNLWISTGSGISLLDKKGTILNFGAAEGVNGGDFSIGCIAGLPDGRILFGSHYGLHTLEPDNIKPYGKAPVPVISSVEVYGRGSKGEEMVIFSPSGEIRVPYDRNTLLVSFNVLDAAMASAVDYWYRVEGVDDRWYVGDSSTGIFLRNLSPGHYTLQIKVALRNSPDEVAITELEVNVTPPLWATWWAKGIYVLLFCVLLFLGFRFYKKRLDLEYALSLERQNSQREQELTAERMRFFTNITHELRTPLTLILGPLEDMKGDKTLSVSNKKRIGVVHKSAARLIDLVNNILEFRKTETQNRSLRVAYGDVAGLVTEIGQKYMELNSNPAVSVDVKIEKGDFRIWHDGEILSMIIDNLMSNASKYTVSGSITLSLYHSEESGVPFTEIAVKDTGIGMSEEALHHIFDRYYRDRSAETRMGTGIGLALVYNLVRLHEGEVFVESEKGRGSVFRFRLHSDNTYPDAERLVKGYVSGEEESVNELAHTSESEDQERPSVLVVEDNVDIINYIVSSLSDRYNVESATNGREGVAKAREMHPDIIISDIMMPEMDGIEMVRALKKSPDTEYIPVIIVTAKVADEARREAYEAGADSYITKPFSSSLLRSRITNIMNSRHRLAQGLIENHPEEPAQVEEGIAQSDETMVSDMNAKDEEFIGRVKEIIAENMANDAMDVGLIAEEMCMSHSTLYRKVKAVTGITVAKLIRKMRACKAGELLSTGKYTVSEISYMVGMMNPGNFRQCFKEEFGMTPSEYLQKFCQNTKYV